MDWRTVQFDWNRARAFLVTAEEGSLSAAARALGMSQPTLGRQVSALEEELGVVLFERMGRALKLTPSGLELVEHVRAMGNAATQVSLVASGQSQSVEGRVCITASEVTSAYVLPDVVARIRREHPGITVEILASNAISDLRRREADIAIRNAAPTDPSLIAKRLKDETASLYAAPHFLKSIGGIATPEDARKANFIGFDGNEEFLLGLQRRGLDVAPDNFAILTASHLVHWELVKKGLGIGVMPTRIGDAEPSVTRAMPWFDAFEFPIWLVVHRELRTSRRVRLVFDILAEALSEK
ncbi:MAG: LysR family transcriptional regulator [Filomicrobium sp.]